MSDALLLQRLREQVVSAGPTIPGPIHDAMLGIIDFLTRIDPSAMKEAPIAPEDLADLEGMRKALTLPPGFEGSACLEVGSRLFWDLCERAQIAPLAPGLRGLVGAGMELSRKISRTVTESMGLHDLRQHLRGLLPASVEIKNDEDMIDAISERLQNYGDLWRGLVAMLPGTVAADIQKDDVAGLLSALRLGGRSVEQVRPAAGKALEGPMRIKAADIKGHVCEVMIGEQAGAVVDLEGDRLILFVKDGFRASVDGSEAQGGAVLKGGEVLKVSAADAPEHSAEVHVPLVI